MRSVGVYCLAILFCLFGIFQSGAYAAVALSENWDSAALGDLPASGTLNAQNTWTLSTVSTPGTATIVSEAGSDRAVAHTVTGSGGSARYFLQAPLSSTVNMDTNALRIEFDLTFNEVLAAGNRHTIFQVFNTGGTGDGYQVRFSGNTTDGKVVLDYATILNGVEDTATDVGPLVPPYQEANKLYHAIVTIKRSGSDTVMLYQVQNITDGGSLVPSATQTFTGLGVATGTVLNQFKLGFRQGSRCAVDNLVISSVSTDTTPPVIALGGSASVSLNCGEAYTDAGATASDNVDGNITANIVTTGLPVNTNVPGPHTITYDVSDAAGNPAVQVTRTVTIANNCPDTTPPVIALTGANPTLVNCHASYIDPGATANDNVDGNITANIVIAGVAGVDTETPGDYTVTYNVSDQAGNPAVQVTRTVTVRNNCNAITINGPSHAAVGDIVTLTVSHPALTGAVNYGWTQNGYMVTNSSDDHLTLTHVTEEDSGIYVVVVSDQSKALFPPSDPFELTVTPAQHVPVAGTLALLLLSVAIAGMGILKRNVRPLMIAALLLVPARAGMAANTAVVETWNAATTGTLASGSVTADNTWMLALGTNGGTLSVVDLGGGDKVIDHTIGTSNNDSIFTRTLPLANQISLTTGGILFKFDVIAKADPGTTGNRHTGLIVKTLGGASKDGYGVRFAPRSDGCRLEVGTINNAAAPVYTQVAAGGAMPAAGTRLRVTVLLRPGTTDTAVTYKVDDITNSTTFIASGTATIAGFVPDAGTTADTALVWVRQNTVSRIDNHNATQDATAPTISLNGSNPMNVTCGTVFSDPGATANDDTDGALTPTATGTVNTGVIGPYTINYNVKDSYGNAATQVSRTVNVVGPCPDTTPPVITLGGTSPVTVLCGVPYSDAGATALDDVDGPITGNNIITGGLPIDYHTIGTYIITYDTHDSSNNNAIQVTRTVNVVGPCDTTAPVITLNGSDPEVVECTQAAVYTDPGATANDNRDGDLTSIIGVSGLPIDAHTPGSHTVTYTVTDVAGNIGTKTRTVNVVDTTNPVVTLNGTATMTVECHGTYTESGASAVDACDTAVSTAVVSGSIDVDTPGVYTLTYTAIDESNNSGSQVRTVTVSDTTPPVITLNGGAMNVSCGATYADPGATATDTCDNNLPAITVGGLAAINTAIPGDYTLTYDVADASSNNALQVTRTVTVLNNCGSVVIDGPHEAIVGDYVTLTALHGLFVGNVNYNWTKDGQGVPGANGRRLIFEEIQLRDAGSYVVTVQDESKGLFPSSEPFVLEVTEITVPLAGPAGLLLLAAGLGASARLYRRKR